MTEKNLIMDLGDSLREVIYTYETGHDIPVALIVGLLHCIAHEIIMENYSYECEEDVDDDF